MTATQPDSPARPPRRLESILFWAWNLALLVFLYLGFALNILPEIFTGVMDGVVPPGFLVEGVLLLLIPPAAILLGRTRLRACAEGLLGLLYGVEGPLLLVLWLRLAVIRQSTPALDLLLAVTALGALAYLWQLLDRSPQARRPWLRHLHTAGLTLLLTVALYACAWLAFYAVPILGLALRYSGEFTAGAFTNPGSFFRSFAELLAFLPSVLVMAAVAWALGTLPLGMAVLTPALSWRAWRARWQPGGHSWAAALVSGVTLVVFLGALGLANTVQQPQQRAFALLAKAPSTPDEARALLEQEGVIRAGLLNAYLARYRYFGVVGASQDPGSLYAEAFGLSPEQARRVQNLYDWLARPLLYVPSTPPSATDVWWVEHTTLQAEAAKAAALYRQFFDQSIEDGERREIVNAARATWSAEDALAAWQEVDEREVYLSRQEITVREHGDWAEVELFEEYLNQTYRRQEVVYYFSLPESAVITGVWLGNTPDRDSRFVYRVSPRGAAQQLYRQEVARRVDPALVEQIGPRQYRLRVFPVLPPDWRWDEVFGRRYTLNQKPMYLWLTWQELAARPGGAGSPGAAWPMPRLNDKANVYWDSRTVRLVNGAPLHVQAEAWLPDSLPATAAVQPVEHRVVFSDGWQVSAQPLSAVEQPTLPAGLSLAVVLDSSRSMAPLAGEVQSALARLAQAAGAGAGIDLYLSEASLGGGSLRRVRLDSPQAASQQTAELLYYGGQPASELLAQFGAGRGAQRYNAILLVTDASGYQLGEAAAQAPALGAPLWIVHLGQGVTYGYDDATLQAIQASGGGVMQGVDEALLRLAAGAAGADVLDGYLWRVESASPGEAQGEPGFAPLAARQVILAELRRRGAGAIDLAAMDALHRLASQNSIVTPYSSMIVLVDEAQAKALNELEKQGDRFQRETEGPGTTAPGVTGVPEPEEWLLMGAAALLLGWYAARGRSRRRMMPGGG